MRLRIIDLIILFSFILSQLLSFKLHAQAYLDYTYGRAGFAEYSVAPMGPHEVTVRVQPDGKIIQAGSVFGEDSWLAYAVTRLNPNGSIDSSFANSGTLILSIGTGHDALQDIAIQADGKILLAGDAQDINVERTFAVVRLNQNGTLDNSFGDHGIVRTTVLSAVNADNQALAISLQRDNKILVGGTVYDFAIGGMALVRYNTDGTLDSTFGIDGKILTRITNSDPRYNGYSSIFDIIVQPDDKLIIVGRAGFDSVYVIAPGNSVGYEITNYVLAKYTSDGSLDNSFGQNGIVLTPMSRFGLLAAGYAYTGALTSDNKILVQGEVYDNLLEKMQVGLVRYNADGNIDSTYGVNGFATASFGLSQNFNDMQIGADGKSLIIGTTRFDSSQGFTILRFNQDGTWDTSFNHGYLYFPSPRGISYAWSAAFQGDNLIVGGNATRDITAGDSNSFLSIRLRPTPVLCSEIMPSVSGMIPDTVSYIAGVDSNTVYLGYSPASSITLRAKGIGGISPYSFAWSTGATTQSIAVHPEQQTTYSVTITDAAGCQTVVNKTIKVTDVRCGIDKVTICHIANANHDQTVCIGNNAVQAHLSKGCKLGYCGLTKIEEPDIHSNVAISEHLEVWTLLLPL